MFGNVYRTSYYPIGDLVVVSICLVMFVLLFFSYNRKSRSFRIFLGIIGLLIVSANASVGFNTLLQVGRQEFFPAINALRCFYHAALFGIFILYIDYILEVTRLERNKGRPYMVLAIIIFALVMAVDIFTMLSVKPTRASEYGIGFQSRRIFLYGYVAYVALIAVLLASIQHRMYRNVMMGFYGSMAVSFGMLLLQRAKGQSSYTVATFLYPVIAMFYIMHANPYDARSGAMDSHSLEDLVRYNHQRGIDFGFMSLYMPDFDFEGGVLPEEIQAVIRHFAVHYFRGATLFKLGPGHLIMVFSKQRNPDWEARTRRMLDDFRVQYGRFRYDYKIAIGESIQEISRSNEYASFVRGVQHGMAMNTVYRIGPEDVRRFRRFELLQEELDDICANPDLDDDRVLVYCQPVYNIHTGRYDTAEALMRLEIKDMGMVYPDRFIPIAEENGQIHALTMIILNKTCAAVKSLMARGYEVSRVSVNVSALELKDEHFCEDVVGILRRCGVPGEKIAIELTESRTDSDFDQMKLRIEELRQHGIKFYLDDFGTGYSNMERIMELPFDIIKFDRSMVLASEASERSRAIVFSLASMFHGLNYSVLYEGVEKDSMERMCMDMSASYLQGYKYSRPVPIERLEEYFSPAA